MFVRPFCMFVSCLNYKTVWLLPFAESPAAFRGSAHSDLHSSSLICGFMEAAQHGAHLSHTTMEAARRRRGACARRGAA